MFNFLVLKKLQFKTNLKKKQIISLFITTVGSNTISINKIQSKNPTNLSFDANNTLLLKGQWLKMCVYSAKYLSNVKM